MFNIWQKPSFIADWKTERKWSSAKMVSTDFCLHPVCNLANRWKGKNASFSYLPSGNRNDVIAKTNFQLATVFFLSLLLLVGFVAVFWNLVFLKSSEMAFVEKLSSFFILQASSLFFQVAVFLSLRWALTTILSSKKRKPLISMSSGN